MRCYYGLIDRLWGVTVAQYDFGALYRLAENQERELGKGV